MYSLPLDDLAFIAKQLSDRWPNGKVFLLTGGTGFFGRWLIESIAYLEALGNYNNKYIIVTRQTREVLVGKIPCLQKPIFQIFQHDLNHPIPKEFSVAYVIHAAADVSSIKSGDSDSSQIVNTTMNTVSAVSKSVPRFLHVSSGAVYIDQNEPEEDSPLVAPDTNSYGAAKRMSELYVQQHINNFYIVRCFAFVGPFADSQMAIMQMLAQKVSGKEIQVLSPSVVRSFLYARDMARVLLHLLVGPCSEQIYNLGSDQMIELGDVAYRISEIPPQSAQPTIKTSSEKISLASSKYVPSVSRLKREIPNFISVPLKEALMKTYDFLKQGVKTI